MVVKWPSSGYDEYDAEGLRGVTRGLLTVALRVGAGSVC